MFALLTPQSVINILVSLLPVLLFLFGLVFLDSYKLVKLGPVLFTIFIGMCVAGLSFVVNSFAIETSNIDILVFKRYIAPVVEEILKAMFVILLLKSKKIGFMVDAAIYGFAVGAGFACTENMYYLQAVANPNPFLWIIRGLGTAIMHGGTTAMVGVVAKNVSDRSQSFRIGHSVPGLAIAIVTHSLFNHFFVSPILSTLFLVILLPTIMLIVFHQSEKATRNWLGVGFDTDIQVLDMITTGSLSETKIGNYLQSVRNRFPGEVVADMLCLLRIHVELSLRAKGMLLMRESGFRVSPDPQIKEKFKELKYLQKSIGKTGHLAIAPFLHTSSRDLWQLHMLSQE